MTTHVTTSNPVRSDISAGEMLPGATPAAGHSRRWALAGIGAGVAGVASIVGSSMMNAVYDASLHGDPDAIAHKLAGQDAAMLLFHTSALVGAVLTVVFAAGLLRRLRARAAADSTAPLVAFAGLVATAVVSVLGSGLDTEFMMEIDNSEIINPVNAALYNHWVGTIPWCWVLAGLTGLAVYAVSRTAGVPRWIGRVGLVLGGLTLVLGISPLQYMAGMTGPLWLLVTAIGFAVGDKAFRSVR